MIREPDDECGITVATDEILARSTTAALVVRSLTAYSEGVLLDLSIHSRAPLGDGWDDVLYGESTVGLRIGYGFDESATPVHLGPVIPPASGGSQDCELLFAGGGDGDTGQFTVRLWITPRRTSSFILIATWPRQTINDVKRTFLMPSEDECRSRIVHLWTE